MGKRCTSVSACACVVLLGAVVIVVWVQFSKRDFIDEQQVNVVNFTVETTSTYVTARRTVPTTKHREKIDRTHLEDLETSEVAYVKPFKISPLPLHDQDKIFDQINNHHDKPQLRHHSGHFKQDSGVWDPHPIYEIDAFGQKLILELQFNEAHIAPEVQVIRHGANFGHLENHTQHTGCIYKGKIRDDENSVVSVDLCNGMTGYIKTSHYNYYIEPIEKLVNVNGSITHRIKRLPHVNSHDNDVLNSRSEGDSPYISVAGNRVIVDDESPTPIVQSRSHSIRKRDVYFDYIDTNELPEQFHDENPPKMEVKISQNEQQNNRRARKADWGLNYSRSSKQHYVRIAVIVDKTMADYHKNDLFRYISILMSHVAVLYKDASIGNAISIAVVQIRILEFEFSPKPNSQEMLSRFCEWKQKQLSESSHNVALLLTRNMICKNYDENRCQTLGVAEVGSMCRKYGCAIVKDKGLSTSYTIAHEIGHILSMPHDDDESCKVHNNDKNSNNIMSQMMLNNTKPFVWSNCSRQFVTEFLEGHNTKCLEFPSLYNEIPEDYSRKLPGDNFTADSQCELQFGDKYQLCPFQVDREAPCKNLWCIHKENGTCKTQWSPWAEGTQCGPNSWCFRRECIKNGKDHFVPIDGGWGPWQGWGACSRSCGGGIMASHRNCDFPTPENGGSYCTGERVRYASCNTQDCEPNSQDFRAMQCAQFNGNTVGLPNLPNNVEWVPKFGLQLAEDLCRLYCRPKNSNSYYRLKKKVLDGTKCGMGSFDICVNGICRPGGCDNKLDSKVELDECGVCGGNNSMCQEITGMFNRSVEAGYSVVVTIPKGSSNLNISQRSHERDSDENYLALVDGETRKYILNGDHKLETQETDVVFGSLIIKYSGTNKSVEWITTMRNHKLSKNLTLMVLSVGNLRPPDITYRYVINKEAAPRYGWRLLYQEQWSKCNSICEGMKFRKPSCVDLNKGEEVPSNYCDGSEDSATEKQPCNTHCELTWNILSKSACSAHCGKGYRRVHYNCMKVYKNKPNFSQEVNARHCNVLAKPPMQEPCNTVCDSIRWDYSNWSECSKTCGGGIQRRTAKCVDYNYNVIEDYHCNDSEKIVEQVCNTETCPIWISFESSPCSAPCGGGYKNISHYCVLGGRIQDPASCDIKSKPSSTKKCNEDPCGRWSGEDVYHPCSVTCGEGVQRRKFVCKKFDSEEILNSEYCRGVPVPNESRVCFPGHCEKPPTYDRYKDDDTDDNSIQRMYNPRQYYKVRWMPGAVSACSKTCGGGIQSQTYHCANELHEMMDERRCDPNTKPETNFPCNTQPCPKWKMGDWSPVCDSNCEKHRQVKCMSEKGTVEDGQCELSNKPKSSTMCALSECQHVANSIPRNYFDPASEKGRFRWKIGAWEQCSNNCGKGTRSRKIVCEDPLNDIIVVDSFCRHAKKPKDSKTCERYTCKYAWIEGFWSPCSTTCGKGRKTRKVACHRVHHGGIVDPVPLPEIKGYRNFYCTHPKPAMTAQCVAANCGDEFIWRAETWKQCTHSCGRRGRQTRFISCVSVRTKQKVPKNHCPRNLRPPRKRKCNQWRCLHNSCREIKHYMKTNENNDYVISIRGRPAQIYCYKMDTNDPEEYISLTQDTQNYAEFYDRRLLDVRTCPYNGERRDNCQCVQVESARSGMTVFWKVRLNITSMQIIGDDFTFSKQIKGDRRMAYGTAGDCYSSVKGCAQGRFSVDLSYTSFRLAREVRWENIGSYSSSDIRKSKVSFAKGKCGGYCGECIPDPNIGLAVEIT